MNWFEENEFIANAVDDENVDSDSLMEIFTMMPENSLKCTPAGIMQDLVECYTYDDSPLKNLGWASSHYYMTKYIKEWLVVLNHFLIIYL